MNIKHETYAFKGKSGNLLKADVYHSELSPKPSGVVFWIHGGALIFGTRKRIPSDVFNFVSENNLLLISLDHRLLPECLVADTVEDVIDGIRWFRDFKLPEMGLNGLPYTTLGESSGAYLALFSGFQQDDLPSVIGCYWGFSSLCTEWCNVPNNYYISAAKTLSPLVDKSVSRLNYFHYLKRLGTWAEVACGAPYEKKIKYYEQFSPILKINHMFPPTVIAHGMEDYDIPISEALNLANKFEEQSVEHLLVTINEGGHLLFDSYSDVISAKISESFNFISSQIAKHD